jgi:hypothetical protein
MKLVYALLLSFMALAGVLYMNLDAASRDDKTLRDGTNRIDFVRGYRVR